MVRYHNSGTQKFDDTEHDSVNTGDATIDNDLTLGDTKLEGDKFVIADDDFATFDLQKDTILLLVGDGANGVSGIYTSIFDNVIEAISTTKTDTLSGPLDGATGAEGNVTISRDGNTGYLENRIGSEVSLELIQFNA